MARPKYIPNANFPSHIRARCINQEWFRVPIDSVWKIFSEQLYLAHHAFNLNIHAFVLMSNHFHLLASTPEGNLAETMEYFMKEVGRQITYESGRINQTFGARYKSSLITSNHYFYNAYKYVYRNPVEAGLANRVELYPYSTLNGLLGQQHLLIPVQNDPFLFENVSSTLDWLNTPPDAENWDAIACALRKSQMKIRKDPHTKKTHYLENNAL